MNTDTWHCQPVGRCIPCTNGRCEKCSARLGLSILSCGCPECGPTPCITSRTERSG